jgi:hypothetical protein
MHRPLYYRRNGTPYEGPNVIFKWGKDFKNPKYQIVKQSKLENGLFVSTVWLGIDHSFTEIGPPIIFETMIFGKDVLDCMRYSTEEQALKGHEQLCRKWAS